jgi:hypothetical protein
MCTVKNGIVKLTKKGIELATHNKREVFSKALTKVEPFKSAIALLKRKKELSTKELENMLYNKGIFFNSDQITDIELLKNLLLKWGVENKLLVYNNSSDMWSVEASQ